jgi:phosphopantothenoylcysteine decarboxylase/phosphopantothenate--cysteine ligase
MKILVTSGATREPIDAVRFISNVSTGTTGAALADELQRAGHAVTLLHGPGAVRPRLVGDCEEFGSAADLGTRLRRRLASGRYHLVIMSAAVADYRPRRARAGKIRSDAPCLRLELVRNPKLLPQLKSFSRRRLLVVGFKLTVGAGPVSRRRAVAALFAAGGVDAVVHNDLTGLGDGPDRSFRLHGNGSDRGIAIPGIRGLAVALGELLPALDRIERQLRK